MTNPSASFVRCCTCSSWLSLFSSAASAAEFRSSSSSFSRSLRWMYTIVLDSEFESSGEGEDDAACSFFHRHSPLPCMPAAPEVPALLLSSPATGADSHSQNGSHKHRNSDLRSPHIEVRQQAVASCAMSWKSCWDAAGCCEIRSIHARDSLVIATVQHAPLPVRHTPPNAHVRSVSCTTCHACSPIAGRLLTLCRVHLLCDLRGSVSLVHFRNQIINCHSRPSTAFSQQVARQKKAEGGSDQSHGAALELHQHAVPILCCGILRPILRNCAGSSDHKGMRAIHHTSLLP